LLLADEPTGNLDSRTGATILDLLRSIGRDHGATIVMATHDQAAARVADRVVRMSDGRIMAEV
jgi:putative ABC transport system ATP-binding protein